MLFQLFDICSRYFQPVDHEVIRWSRLCLASSVVLIRCLLGCWRSAPSNWRRSSVDCSARLCALAVCAVFQVGVHHAVTQKACLDGTDVKNYRPISNLTVISKLLERVILRRLLEHLKANGLLPSVQSAYRKCHSTETAIAIFAAGCRLSVYMTIE